MECGAGERKAYACARVAVACLVEKACCQSVLDRLFPKLWWKYVDDVDV